LVNNTKFPHATARFYRVVSIKLVCQTIKSCGSKGNKLDSLSTFDYMKNKRLLYKYQSYNQYLFNLLINCEFWMSPPDKLNDPFEGDFRVKEIKKFQNEPTIKRLLEYSKKNLLDELVFAENLKEAQNDINVLSNFLYEYVNSQIRSKYGITCFSRNRSSVRMWSHYADSHKGVCLIFDEDKLISDINMKIYSSKLMDVHYSQSLPFIDIINHDSDQDNYEYIGISNDNSFLFNKQKSWKYENEVRLVIDSNFETFPDRRMKFSKDSLVGIILGARIQNDNKTALDRLFENKDLYNGIKFYKAIKEIEYPRLRIERIK